MRIRTKIYLGYGLILGSLIISAFANFYIRGVQLEATKKIREISYYIEKTDHLTINILQMLMPANDYIITRNKSEIKNFQRIYEDVIKLLEEVERETTTPEIIREIRMSIDEIRAYSAQIFSITINEKTISTAANLMYQMDRTGDSTRNTISEHHKLYLNNLNELESSFNKNSDLMGILSGIIWTLLIIISTTTLYIFNNDIKKPIEKLSHGFRGVSHGRWSQVDLYKNDELGKLAVEFNLMVERLESNYDDLENEVRSRTKDLNDLNKKLEEMAITDGLSGLYNHKYFFEKLREEYDRALRYNRKLAVFMIDIDHFKHFNDEFGHQAGDYAIEVVSRILKEESRKTDIVSRYGGEEFVILSPEMDSEQAETYAERIRKKVENVKLTGEGKTISSSLTISIGVCVYPDRQGDPETILQYADEALYRAKRNGRNQVDISKS